MEYLVTLSDAVQLRLYEPFRDAKIRLHVAFLSDLYMCTRVSPGTPGHWIAHFHREVMKFFSFRQQFFPFLEHSGECIMALELTVQSNFAASTGRAKIKE